MVGCDRETPKRRRHRRVRGHRTCDGVGGSRRKWRGEAFVFEMRNQAANASAVLVRAHVHVHIVGSIVNLVLKAVLHVGWGGCPVHAHKGGEIAPRGMRWLRRVYRGRIRRVEAEFGPGLVGEAIRRFWVGVGSTRPTR